MLKKKRSMKRLNWVKFEKTGMCSDKNTDCRGVLQDIKYGSCLKLNLLENCSTF